MSSIEVRSLPIMQNKKIAWSAVFLWMAVIFAFSAQAHSGDITALVFHDFNFIVRKCAHMCEYSVLFLLLRHATKLTWPGSVTLLPFAMTVAYSMSDEFHQMFVPGRTATINDVLIDSTGAAIVWIALSLWQRFRSP